MQSNKIRILTQYYCSNLETKMPEDVKILGHFFQIFLLNFLLNFLLKIKRFASS